jgi:hypothetical protein
MSRCSHWRSSRDGISGKLKQKLDAAGIKPVFDPKMIGATFYRRNDL